MDGLYLGLRQDKTIYYVTTFQEAYRASMQTMRGLLNGNFSGEEKRKWSFCAEDKGPYKIEVPVSKGTSHTQVSKGKQSVSTTLPVAEAATCGTVETKCGDTWNAYLMYQKSFWQDTLKRKAELTEKLSQVDKAISDIHHYIERQKFNAAQGYKILIKEKSVLEERRRIKTELKKINIFEHAAGEVFCTKSIEDKLRWLDESEYKPRVLTDLFDEQGGV
jgi:virulence-associated protein VapD